MQFVFKPSGQFGVAVKRTLQIKPPFKFIPIGMGYVLSCLERAGIPMDVLDVRRLAMPVEHDLDRFSSGEYLAVGTGGFFYGINWFREIVAQLRLLQPQVSLVLGIA